MGLLKSESLLQRLVFLTWIGISVALLWLAFTSLTKNSPNEVGFAAQSIQQAQSTRDITNQPNTSYAGTHWTLLETRTTQSQDRLCALSPDLPCHPVVVAETLVTNNTRQTIGFSTKDISLELNNKNYYATEVNDAHTFDVSAGSTESVTILFLPAVDMLPNPEQITFSIQESDRNTQPARISVDAAKTTTTKPILGQTDDETFRTIQVDETTYTIKPQLAVLDLDHNHYRAANKHTLVHIDLIVERPIRKTQTPHFDATFWTLTTDKEEEYAPTSIKTKEGKFSGQDQVSLQFVIPSNIRAASLQAGNATSEEIKYTFND